MILSIIIVNYNTAQLLQNCLSSIYTNNHNIKPEIYIIDNASTDNSVPMIKKMFPQVKIIQNKQNLLYSKANNQGLKKARGKYNLIINSDTILHKDILKKMIKFMENTPTCGLASCREIDQNNKTLITCHKFHTPITQILELPPLIKFFKKSKILQKMRYSNWDRKSIKRVDTVPGSFLLIKKEILQKIGLFDEKLLLFYSDEDLCKRVADANFDIYHNGKVTITHLTGKTLKNFSLHDILKQSYNDMVYYYKKHYGIIWSMIIFFLTRISLIYYKIQNPLR